MKLSEAIRLGAMATPQAFGATIREDGSRCALGAALLAIGCGDRQYTAALEHFPVTLERASNPVTGEDELVLSAVRLLNDEHQWSRQQIADWVATVEPADEQQPEAKLIETPEPQIV